MRQQTNNNRDDPSFYLIREDDDFFPPFGGSKRPEAESAGRRNFIHLVAIVSLAFSVGYLSWRLLETINLDVWWVALPLFAAETHNVFGLFLYTLALWRVDAGPPWHAVESTDKRVAVLLPTYNEPAEVLLPAIAAALAIELPHETWVLDDGRRPEVEQLARDLGASYLTRPDNLHAKAGNLNYAISQIDAELYVVFDADHVARPAFLKHTLCYFDDPKVAIVQTPQDFYNRDSFEHLAGAKRETINEESVFYRVIAPGKNYWDGSFWCGTGAIIRAAALEDVGGVATDTITEDIHTTIKMNRRGWKAVYHNEVLAMGLAPTDALQYMLQRNRWAIGAMQTLRKENPLFGRGLNLGQRLSFATTLLAWFDAWRTLTFVLLPAAVIFTGASPIDAPATLYVPLFILAFSSQFFALRLLSRGYYAPVFALMFEMLRLPAVLPATLSVLTPGKPRKFSVTPKGQADQRVRVQPPLILTVLLLVCMSALLWYGLSCAGLTFTDYEGVRPVVTGSAIFAAGNLWILWLAVSRIRHSAFSGERRSSVRFDVFLRASLDGEPCVVNNISLTGARVQAGAPRPPGSTVQLRLEAVTILGEVLPPLDSDQDGEIRLRYRPGQSRQIGDLMLMIMRYADDVHEQVAGNLAAA